MDKPETDCFNVQWSLSLLSTLAKHGVTDIVISPGSRSTPLVLAAASLPEFKKHIILDERSAAFFALGISKISGNPAALICTSGTAGANYYPAVIEAFQSYTPLIVITADRPAAMQNKHAPQTIRQHNLFGNFTVMSESAEDLRPEDNTVESAVEISKRLFTAASELRGPVHLNAPFDKPLEPNPDNLGKIISGVREQAESMWNHDESCKKHVFPDGIFQKLCEKLSTCKRPLIIAGPSTINDGAESALLNWLKNHTNIPLLAEGVSGLRCFNSVKKADGLIFGYESSLRSTDIVNSLKPDFILRVGLPPVSDSLNRFLKQHSGVLQWCVSHARHKPDPDDTADDFLQIPFFGNIDHADVRLNKQEKKWLLAWKEYEKSFLDSLPGILNENKTLTDGAVVHTVINNCSKKSVLFTSNSLLVRDIDLFYCWPFPFQSVMHNRGASGIDGITSTAAGVAMAADKPVVLLTGDLAFIHDSGGLFNLSSLENKKFTIVIVNNGGGTIFRMLPVHQYADYYTRYFETPQQADIQKLCESAGLDYSRAEHLSGLISILKKRETETGGVRVIECITNADESFNQRNKLWNLYQKKN